MGQEKESEQGNSLYSAWFKASKDYWDTSAKMLSESPLGKTPLDQGAFTEQMNTWLEFMKAMGSPEVSGPGKNLSVEIFTKYMESVWPFLSAPTDGEGKAGKAEDLRAMSKRMAKSWFELFDNELRKVLNIPQLGLTRYYQEHVARAIEEYNDFQITMTNFVNLLTEPLIETTEKVREQVKTTREGGEELVKDAKEQYKLWINKLEEAYLELLKSPEYTSALTEVLKALRDYKVSRQQLLIDLFQDLPVPTHKDMDELYKELYYLKKRVKELEKRGKKND